MNNEENGSSFIAQLDIFPWLPDNTLTDWTNPRIPVRIIGHLYRFVISIKALWAEWPFGLVLNDAPPVHIILIVHLWLCLYLFLRVG